MKTLHADPRAEVDTYEYDQNGNMTCRIEKGITYLHSYNGENRLTSVQKLATGTCAEPLTYAVQWDFAHDGDVFFPSSRITVDP